MDIDMEDDHQSDEQDPHAHFFWQELAPVLVCYGITFIFGSVGNALIVYATYRNGRMQSVTNVFLASLAIADLLLIILCIPVKVAKLFSYTWDAGWLLCKGVHYVQNVSTLCSVFTLTAISVERYYAIVHPMKARYICTISQAQRVILITWCLSILLATPILHVQIMQQVGEEHQDFYWCIRDWDSPYWRWHEIYMLLLVLIIPFCIMTLTYVAICWEVWNVMERRHIMTSSHALNRKECAIPLNEVNSQGTPIQQQSQGNSNCAGRRDDSKTVKQVIYMLVVIVLVFAICWTPLLVDNLLTAYGILSPVRGGWEKHMGTIFTLMAYFNSCINPVIYGFMSKNFRDSFRSVLCCFLPRQRDQRHMKPVTSSVRQISRTGSQTRNTIVR
ncbi:QRFP-like peptide receptor [Atheta coriaria]|uniref:QRFP-like peptide receptor n=1 Tax=Dalotia coriaria TaxID=877792 RepID=UPI0031F416B4